MDVNACNDCLKVGLSLAETSGGQAARKSTKVATKSPQKLEGQTHKTAAHYLCGSFF
jgi:hypothetical protein